MHEIGKPVVLAVDDDPSILRLITIVLERSGMEVEAVNSGAAAINALADRSFDAVILDLTMPLVSGFEVISYLRHANPAALRRVVVITAMSDSAVRRLDHSLVFSVMAKPFDIVKFERTVTGCIGASTAAAPISDATLPIKSEEETVSAAPVVRDDLPLSQMAAELEVGAPLSAAGPAPDSAISTPAMDDANPDPK